MVGMHDYLSGLEKGSFSVKASVAMDGVPAGEELAGKFAHTLQSVREWKLEKPVRVPAGGLRLEVSVSVRDKSGNGTRVVRTIGGNRVRVATR